MKRVSFAVIALLHVVLIPVYLIAQKHLKKKGQKEGKAKKK